jgi:hypothetical protein
MREKTPQSVLKWISRTYDMSPAALALMFQRDRRTVDPWLRGSRISVRNGTKIRSSFSSLAGLRDPLDLRGPAVDI